MKSLCLTLSLALASSLCLAQSRDTGSLKGKYLLGGAISYKREKSNAVIETRLTLAPLLGYFLSGDRMVGSKIQYQYHWRQDEGQAHKKVKSWEHIIVLNSFVRQYFKLGYRLYPYLQGGVELGWGADYTRSGEGDSSFAWGVDLSPGMHFMLTQSVGIDFILGRFGYHSFSKNMKETHFGLELDKLSLGILFFL